MTGPEWKFRKHKRSMAEHIRKKTHNGREIVEFMLNVMRGENIKQLNVRDRIEAAKFLADRGWGRAVEQSVQLRLEASQSPEVLDELPTSDLLEVIRALKSPSQQVVNALPASVEKEENPMAEIIEAYVKDKNE